MFTKKRNYFSVALYFSLNKNYPWCQTKNKVLKDTINFLLTMALIPNYALQNNSIEAAMG